MSDALPAKRPGGKRAALKPPPDAEGGRVSSAITALIDSLDLEGDLTRLALAELAMTLAHGLDAGAGMAAAAMVKEMRATLRELGGGGASDDDLFSEWERQLSNPG